MFHTEYSEMSGATVQNFVAQANWRSGFGHCYVATLVSETLFFGSKVHPRKDHEGPEGGKSYSFTLPLTSPLVGVAGQRHAPAALPRGKTRYPLYRKMGGPRAGVDGCGKSRPQLEFGP